MTKDFLTEIDLKNVGFILNEEDDSWHKDGFAVSVNEETNDCLFFIESPSNPDDLIEIKEFVFKHELEELWKVIKGDDLFLEPLTKP